MPRWDRMFRMGPFEAAAEGTAGRVYDPIHPLYAPREASLKRRVGAHPVSAPTARSLPGVAIAWDELAARRPEPDY